MKTLKNFRILLQDNVELGKYQVSAWVRTHRRSKNVSFLNLNDGSCLNGLQVVIEPDNPAYLKCVEQIHTGCSVSISGELVESPAKGQKYEFQLDEISLIGEADPEEYFLQKKKHTLETLRTKLHIRPRSNTLSAAFRVRSRIAYAVHKFFQERDFYYIHTPIITDSDCEGAGEMFQVTTLNMQELSNGKKLDYAEDFFHKPSFLTVSGQLEGEIFATALGNIYTFGPTFRAENSNTSRHLSEFWMIEPEMAFCDLDLNKQIAEEFIKFLLNDALENLTEDLEFLHTRDWVEGNLQDNLRNVLDNPATSITYTEAIQILEEARQDFEFPVSWGIDLQAEHERFLTEQHFKSPVFVTDYPASIKPFYMRANEDQKTVRGMDLLVPGIGEIIGGGQREERYDLLQKKMQDHGLGENYEWYLDLRRFGTVPHAGFGLGFERFLMYLTGLKNIRDVVAIPRYPGHGGIL